MEEQKHSKWVCNSCDFSDYTDVVPERDLEYLQCSNCGNDEFHLVAINQAQ